MRDSDPRWQELTAVRERLDHHPVYGMLRSLDDLRRFMAHHIYSVWDFMSLVKTLQAAVAPTRVPWLPPGDPTLRRFINAIVLEEESDIGSPDGETFLSHFELYCRAMREVGADPEPALRFLALVRQRGIASALDEGDIPEVSREFMRTTFGFIATCKPHIAAAALALGREQVIPAMFRSFLREMDIDESAAPSFHFYLKRHIHLDEDFHAPQSLRLLANLCGDDPYKQAGAHEAACKALGARLRFWNGVAAAIDRGWHPADTAPAREMST